MNKKHRHLKRCYHGWLMQSGMTLVEILVSMVILMVVIVSLLPLLTQSQDVTNLSNIVTSKLLADQETIEIVVATKAGVLLEDGTFLAEQYFPVIFSNGETPCSGMIIKKNDLVRFLASIPHIKTTALYEGYSPSEAQITIMGSNTHFIDHKTKIQILNNNGNSVTGYSDFTVEDTETVTLTLPTGSNQLTNLDGPYTITLQTGNEHVTTLLPVHLPRAIAYGGDTMLISSNGSYWVKKPSVSFSYPLNEIVFKGDDGNGNVEAFIAVANEGRIYLWPNQGSWHEVYRLPSTDNLNDIICTQDLILTVGDSGKILTSTNGVDWFLVDSNSDANLLSITYSPGLDKFICVGDGGVIITSDDGYNWQMEHTWPKLAKGSINGKNAVQFSGLGDYLKTIHAPVTGSTNRTIFMVAGPEPNSETLMAWGSPLNTVNGGQFTMRLDKGNVRIEQNAGPGTTTSFTPPTDGTTPSLISCRSTSNSFNSYELAMNGSIPEQPTANGTINTDSRFPLQLGSDPLTRYTGPLNYKGLVAEVLIYDRALSRNRVSDDEEKYYASEMDIVAKYLADKYSISIDTLEGEEMENIFVQATNDTLKNTRIEAADLPHGAVLWLDASELSMNHNQQVLRWLDRSDKGNHSAGAALRSIACSDTLIIAAGDHRNLIYSEDSKIWNQRMSLTGDGKMTAEYRFDSILFTGEKYLALVNDGLGNDPKNGLIFSSEDGLTWSISHESHRLNDLDYQGSTLMVVGNNRTIILSDEGGSNWQSLSDDDFESGINSDLDLTVGVIR